jgi:DNA topoisomerase-1
MTTTTYKKYLVIVESPAKCPKIEKYLGIQYQCIATKGCLRKIQSLHDIQMSNNYEINFCIEEDKEQTIKELQKNIKKFNPSNIFIATDDDREGEAIAWHLCILCDLSIETTKRVIFHEITKDAIQKAFANPTHIDLKKVFTQHSRQVLDIVIGFTISPYLSKYLFYDKNNSLSAGRCQTPALKLIFENEQNNMKLLTSINKHRHIFATFNDKVLEDVEFTFHSTQQDENQMKQKIMELSNKSFHLSLLPLSILSNIPAPKPLTTSVMLHKANKYLHFSVEVISNLAQQLYEKGYITYIRTETPLFSFEFLETVKKYFADKEKSKSKKIQKYIFAKDDAKLLITETIKGTHEAIRPTDINVEKINEEDAKLNSLYQWIHKHTIMCCMEDCIIETQKIIATTTDTNTITNTITNDDNKNDEYFFANISRIQKKGWKKIITNKNDDDDEEQNHNYTPYEEYAKIISYVCSFSSNREDNILGSVRSDWTLTLQKIYTKTDFSKIKHYTEGTLIKKLNELKIGRPSTFANILQNLFKKNYIEEKKENVNFTTTEFQYNKNDDTNKIITIEKEHQFKKSNRLTTTHLGQFVCYFLLQHFGEFFEYDYTKKMEADLDEIQFANKIWYEPCEQCYALLKQKKQQLKKEKICKKKFPLENGEYELLFATNGLTIRKCNTEHFFGVKNNIAIDLQKLENGDYSLQDLMEEHQKMIGCWNEDEIWIKKSIWGYYLQHKDAKIKIDNPAQITMNDAIGLLEQKNNSNLIENNEINLNSNLNPNILRIITKNLSIRSAKKGVYLFFKTEKMEKPLFYNIGQCKNYMDLPLNELKKWIAEKYGKKVIWE